MAINLRAVPFSVTHGLEADPAADVTVNMFRMPAEGRVLAFYAVNDAAISASTNTLAVHLVSRGTSGTAANTTIASILGTSAWVADVPRTGTLTAANQDIASGTWLAYFRDEAGTGNHTRMTLQMDYMLATGPTT